MKRLLLLLFASFIVIGATAWGGDESPPVPAKPVIEQQDAFISPASPVEIEIAAGNSYSPGIIKGELILNSTFELKNYYRVKERVRWYEDSNLTKSNNLTLSNKSSKVTLIYNLKLPSKMNC